MISFILAVATPQVERDSESRITDHHQQPSPASADVDALWGEKHIRCLKMKSLLINPWIMRAWNIMKSCFKVFGSYKNAARAPKVSPQSVQRSKSGGEACSNDSKSRSFVRQSVFNRRRLNSKERTTYDRKVRIGAQLPNGEVFYLGQCVLCLLWMSVATGKFREKDSKSRVLKLSKR